MAYFDTKKGSLEEAIRKAVGGQIDEAKIVLDLENDDPKLMRDIKKFGLKIKDLGDSGNEGYNEYEISGPQSKIDAARATLDAEAAAVKYKTDRTTYGSTTYASFGDQLDMLYKDIVAGKIDTTGTWASHIKAVKDANPKP